MVTAKFCSCLVELPQVRAVLVQIHELVAFHANLGLGVGWCHVLQQVSFEVLHFGQPFGTSRTFESWDSIVDESVIVESPDPVHAHAAHGTGKGDRRLLFELTG